MPIYEYQCGACGHRADEMQKLSAAPLTDCPACGQAAYTKLISAVGFQLKGSGWYATDFKGGGNTASPSVEAAPSSSTSSSEAAAATPAAASATGGHSCGTGGCGSCT